MSKSSRRTFLGQLGAATVLAPGLRNLQTPAPAAQAPGAAASYDLLITGGRVIDPSQKLSAERDVAIAGGRIARIAANIPPSQARQVYDAKGKIVTPGLIDIHTHVYKYGINLNVDSDAVGFQSGVTTLVDAGSTGTGTFLGFRKYVIETAATRIYALLNISSIGLVVTNEIYLDPANDQRAADDPHDRREPRSHPRHQGPREWQAPGSRARSRRPEGRAGSRRRDGAADHAALDGRTRPARAAEAGRHPGAPIQSAVAELSRTCSAPTARKPTRCCRRSSR